MASKDDTQKDRFNNLLAKFAVLVTGRQEEDRIRINKILDNLNSLNYRYPVITNTTVSSFYIVTSILILLFLESCSAS